MDTSAGAGAVGVVLGVDAVMTLNAPQTAPRRTSTRRTPAHHADSTRCYAKPDASPPAHTSPTVLIIAN